jgi:hypothetical protein
MWHHVIQYMVTNCCLSLQNIFCPGVRGSQVPLKHLLDYTASHLRRLTAVRTENLLAHDFVLWNIKNNPKHKYWNLNFHPSHTSSDLVFTVTYIHPHINNSLPPFRLHISWHFYQLSPLNTIFPIYFSKILLGLPSGLPTKILHALHVCSTGLHV